MDGKAMRGAVVSARGLGMDGPRGPVYGDVTFDAPPGSLVAVRGPSGSGRTCLLLTLTGRMRQGTGRAEVDGYRLPRRAAAVRRIAALGPLAPLTDPEPALSVAEHLRERTLLARRFTAAPLTAAGLDPAALPRGVRTRVRDLGQLDVFRLGVALALTAAPRLIAVDDVGHRLTADERAAAWALLRSLADRGLTVLAVGEPPDGVGALTVHTAAPVASTARTPVKEEA